MPAIPCVPAIQCVPAIFPALSVGPTTMVTARKVLIIENALTQLRYSPARIFQPDRGMPSVPASPLFWQALRSGKPSVRKLIPCVQLFNVLGPVC